MKLPNETSIHGKWYDDACGTAYGMELVGERWALLVLRELMLGPRRFSDLRASLPGISAKVLTERLAGLEQAGALVRRQLPPPGKAQVYELTAWGYAAEPILQEIGRWAAMSSGHDPLLPLSPVSLMLSMRTMADYTRTGTIEGKVGFAIGDEEFLARPCAGELPIRRGGIEQADALFRAPLASIIAGGIYAGVPWEELEAGAGLSIEGDRDLAMRFVALFSLPPKLA
ncbi:winged helix-turn-helix transcriptional regulator [Parerythrobacter lacustris]|uniref:Helix-turn-helix transcriptional regulator n=1 Tax=Parerythrobacter lacustris TaxID=2969984 RepID=A0ABT1XTZ6_9SPHN|nr:helix-turn-helix domain-containing protein [Parerythrobacter lacustris]MCR2835086.1 helix-turn-helix transcriptional regulator [Parerythrobacter lacustris]